MKSRWLSTFMVLALAVLCVTANVAYSQGTTGDIEGTISDSNGAPLPGASVEIKSVSLQGTRTAVTDAAGRFRFPAVPGGTYTVTAALSGFSKVERTNVRVALGATATLPITMTVSVKEEIVVTGEAPVIDTAKTTIGVSSSGEQISRLPLARNFTSIASTAPGTGTDNSGGITFYGATGLENQYIIDGVNTTGIKIGDQGKTLNNEFIQEVEVKTGGYEAEYGRALGGTINVVTKSGGNEFHGDGFGYYDSKNLAAADAHQSDRDRVAASRFFNPNRNDFGADLGGYFLKDRLWFFGAGNRVSRDQDYLRVTSINYNPDGTVPNVGGAPTFDAFNRSAGTDERRTTLYSGKLTARLGESNTIALSVFGDPTTFNGRQVTTRGPDSGVVWATDSGGTDLSAKYDGIFGTSFLLSGQYSHHAEKNDNSSPFSDTQGILLVRGGLSELAPGSGPIYFLNEKYKRDDYKATGSFFFGAHEIKVGGEYENLGSTFSEKYPGTSRIVQGYAKDGAFSYQYNRYFATVPLNCQATYNADGTVLTKGNFGPPASAAAARDCAAWQVAQGVNNPPTTHNVGLFAQDSWKVVKNLTVNAGVRYEEQRLLDAAGATAIKISGEWSPRLGIVWDPANNGRSKVYGSFGRYYSTIPQDIQTRALGNEYTAFAYQYGGPSSTPNPVTDFGYPISIQGGELVQPNLKGMYQDELIAGVEYEVFKGWSLGVKGIYKKLGRVIEDRCDLLDTRVNLSSQIPTGALTTCALINPGDDSALQVIKDPTNPACQGDFATTGVLDGNCPSINPSRYYRGVELTANHRFSNNFYTMVSYIYSKLEGNYSGNFSQTRETGQTDPNINADFDYIDLTPNNYGRLRNDRTHQAKFTGTYAFPFGLVASTNAAFQSGRPMSIRSFARPGYSQEHYVVARGSFDQLPSTYNVDLHLEYGIRFGGVSITPLIDVFNVTNVQTVTSRDEVFCTSGSAVSGCNAHVDVNGVIVKPKLADGVTTNPAYATTPTRLNGPLTNARAQNVNFNKDIAWNTPRVFRIGARVSF
jgi:Carboxypeptidase regulatory-like domain/TonB dependent receptor/TonB-dependent Receptor Plug Domain